MVIETINFTTGPSTLPDVGELSYNGCKFSPLYQTNVSGRHVKDDATRTIKFTEYTLTADGYVTLPAGVESTSSTMSDLKAMLSKQAGVLTYRGRGNDIVVNIRDGDTKDAAWGPIPEILEFQPLGGGRSAKVKWQVKVHIIEPGPAGLRLQGGFGPLPGGAGPGGPGVNHPFQFFVGDENRVVPGPAKGFNPNANGPQPPAQNQQRISPPRMLQFNYESSVSYGEDGYSTLSNRGILEIPLTRDPTQATRTFQQTADELRGEIERRVMAGIELAKFRITQRRFTLSRDKRTLDWDITAEEKPYMDLPPACTIARGTYNVRPAKAGMGMCLWLCTLRMTYTLRADRSRRVAWLWFLALLRERMAQSRLSPIIDPDRVANPRRGLTASRLVGINFTPAIFNLFRISEERRKRDIQDSRKAFLIDFSVDEGLCLDSKTTTFSATWRLVCPFSHILVASGLWRKIGPENTFWALSMKDVQGVQSWMPNKARTDIIVDFGGG